MRIRTRASLILSGLVAATSLACGTASRPQEGDSSRPDFQFLAVRVELADALFAIGERDLVTEREGCCALYFDPDDRPRALRRAFFDRHAEEVEQLDRDIDAARSTLAPEDRAAFERDVGEPFAAVKARIDRESAR